MNDKIDKAKLVERLENELGYTLSVDIDKIEVWRKIIKLINSGEFDCKDDDIPKSIIDKLDRAKQCAINADKNELISLFSSIIKDLLNHIDKNCQTKDKQ